MVVCRPAAGSIKSAGGVLQVERINEQNFPCHLQQATQSWVAVVGWLQPANLATNQPHRRHSRKSGNPETQRGRTLSEKQKPDRLDSRLRGNDEILDYGNLSGMIESIGKTTGIYQKNRNPTAVIPAKAGIQKHNVTGIYRKKQKPPPPSFPRMRESRPVGTETYRIKQFP